MPGQFYVTDLPMDPSDAQQQTSTGITQTTTEVEHDVISKIPLCAKKYMKVDRKHTIDHFVCHVGKVKYTRCVTKWYGCTADDDSIEPSAKVPPCFLTRYGQKRHRQKA